MENKNTKYLHNKKNSFNFATSKGALAHLARAFDWQSRGGRFESCMLHKIKRPLKIRNLSTDFQRFFYITRKKTDLTFADN